MKKLNCWEFKRCGRQPGGEYTRLLGVCPAATEERLDGVHGGKNAGRACWVIAGSMCEGEVQGTFAKKFGTCAKCNFYQKVKEEEKEKYQLPSKLLSDLSGESTEKLDTHIREENNQPQKPRDLANKIVARFMDGKIMKGNTSDFYPNKSTFHITLFDGEIIEIKINQLKAIYFVKDFTGNKHRQDNYIESVPGGGQRLEIYFKDGEKIIGYSQGYSPNRSGFFVIPADTDNNNERIYVINAATKKVTFLR